MTFTKVTALDVLKDKQNCTDFFWERTELYNWGKKWTAVILTGIKKKKKKKNNKVFYVRKKSDNSEIYKSQAFTHALNQHWFNLMILILFIINAIFFSGTGPMQ